ncbi:serine carboxypeptidase 1-like [Phoenix dactylifera]|uniref:Carboxypeptidase n=1 Tax=Phoenix dactylifera TaxID=42345 RepID=A0A8B8ZXA1_PHODC|nr:serine carboxypeptidase 1-like [Phoenix dactylifera]XP_038978940.1 serine carboxypeptidase 1-like [Phoenix dactylifera]
MMTAYFSLLLISCCLFVLPNNNEANQADHLRRLIKTKRPTWPHQSYSWADLDAAVSVSPVYVSNQDGLMEADRIKSLPGQPTGVEFNQYSGYVTVDTKNGRALFYYFVESQHNPSTKPLILWLNGGPGCSSLGYGAMQELGPFRVHSDGKTLQRNKYAWNNVANVLFLESPAGVGFSYSNTSSDYDMNGDQRTAEDSYTFLVNWFERFPHYKNHEFFITGESYAGHYVPQLASTILHHNTQTNQTVINLQGVAIGNAFVDSATNDKAGYEFMWNHNLISDETYAKFCKACNFSGIESTVDCAAATEDAYVESGDIDPYNIYAPKCDDSNTTSMSGIAMADFDPCSTSYVDSYLNNLEVQKALHIKAPKLPNPWQSCSNLAWVDMAPTMLPTIKQLITSRIRLWLFSGDIDTVVSITATKYAVRNLNLPIKSSWRAWYSKSQVGGYVVGYEGLAFVTVRGAGHMVPSYQPERALTMISSFLKGELPPAS